MSLELPINYSCNIKCPSCEHNNLYQFRIEDIEKINFDERDCECEIKYKFDTYLICKNPLCNYDIHIIGNVIEFPINILKLIQINKIK